ICRKAFRHLFRRRPAILPLAPAPTAPSERPQARTLRTESESFSCGTPLRQFERLVLLVTPNAGLNAAFLNSPAPANRLAVFSTAWRASAGPLLVRSLAGQFRPCPSKRAMPGFSKTKRRAHTPSIKTVVMDLLTERARSACLDADRS